MSFEDMLINNLKEEIKQLKQQLAEKEKEIEALKQRLKDTIKIYSDDFVEKDKELNELRYKVRIADQAKTDFAIEQLEKAREEIDKRPVSVRSYENREFDEILLDDVFDVIDQQIKELKEGK